MALEDPLISRFILQLIQYDWPWQIAGPLSGQTGWFTQLTITSDEASGEGDTFCDQKRRKESSEGRGGLIQTGWNGAVQVGKIESNRQEQSVEGD